MTDAAFDHSGSSVDDFLSEEGLLDDAEALAMQRVIAWQVAQEMSARGMDRETLAERIGATRSQVDHLLDADDREMDLTVLSRAARAVGKRLRIEMVDAA